jgi:hypothetical protein
LGGCSQELTREHYISKSILELVEEGTGKKRRYVQVFGLKFQGPNPVQKIGVARLTARILCKTHHRLLCRFDSAGKEMFLAAQSLKTVAVDPTAPHRKSQVDGDELERWILKAFIGGFFSGNFQVAPQVDLRGVFPPLELLEILFNGAPFPTGQGLYWMPPKPGDIVTTDPQSLRVSPLVSPDGQDVAGFFVWFFGFQFALLTAGFVPGVPTMFDKAFYRPAGMKAVGSNTQIVFNWQGGPQSREIVLNLRET